jgi:O-methyltransferase
MKRVMKAIVQAMLRPLGLKAVRIDSDVRPAVPPDFGQEDLKIIRDALPFTMTSSERIYSLIQAVRYVVNNGTPGDIVECGVWRGGNIVAAVKTLMKLGSYDRNLYLFDTFEGMADPEAVDISFDGERASETQKKLKSPASKGSNWCRAELEEVRSLILSLGYDNSKIHFIKGKVENTIPESAPEEISLLRLDTDWYSSTKHELDHLFPRLCPGGILIIDDYGHWQGARKAVDEYFAEHKISLFLSRIDYTGRLAIKPFA